MTAPLSPADLEVLEFEREMFKDIGRKADAISERFGLVPSIPGRPSLRYYQRLDRILDNPAALVYDAQHVNRLLRLRAARRANRRTA